MRNQSLLAGVVVLLGASLAAAQVPVGNQATFGRTSTGRSYPFLNRHAYGATVDSGRPIPNGSPHAYGSVAVSQPDVVAPTPNLPGPSTSPLLQNSGFLGTRYDVYPTVPLYLGAPNGFFFGVTSGQLIQSQFVPVTGFPATTPVISTVSPGSFQSASFVR
jgi:hypothetical protein